MGIPSVYEERLPFESNQERLVTNALIEATAPAAVVRQVVNPPARVLFPPRFGYRVEELTIDDVMNINRYMPDRRQDFSGSTGAYGSSSQPGIYG
jgi:hypothetical protein